MVSVTADKVVVELMARVDKAERDIKKYASDTEKAMAKVERASTKAARKQEMEVKRAAATIKREQAGIAASLKGMAASLATGFSAAKIVSLTDSFTRLQNSLRVSGLEGQKLEDVQARLLDMSTRYGVAINDLASLYGNSAQAASELGASSAQLLQLTEASAQALKITGTSAAQAQGALLGLTQALAAGTVRAEEFNQINEGGLRPLLQVAANTDKYGGSVARLRTAVVDGKVSSEEFYQAILAGSQELDAKASKATLTTAAAFESLNNKLIVYLGEADKASGASAALASAIGTLADNLDTLIPAVSVLAVALGSRMVVGALAGGTALKAISAYASIATTSLAGTALAARGAGAALLAAFGGPVGLALTALTVGIAYLATRTDEATEAAGKYRKVQDEATKATSSAADAADALATAHGKARDQALALARAERENIKQKLASAQASLILAEAEAVRARESARRDVASAARSSAGAGGGPDRLASATNRQGNALGQASANIKAAESSVIALQGALAKIDAAMSAAPRVAAVAEGKKTKTPKAPKGPTKATEAQFNSDLRRLQAERIQDEMGIVQEADRRLELQQQLFALEYEDRKEALDASTEYTAKQKAALRAALDRNFGIGPDGTMSATSPRAAAFNQEFDRQIQQEALEAALAANRNAQDLLLNDLDLATTRRERLDLERNLVNLAFEAERMALEDQRLDQTISQAKRDEAEARLKILDQLQAGAIAGAERNNESPLQNFIRRESENLSDFGDSIEDIGVKNIEAFSSGIADAIVNAKSLQDVFKNVAKSIVADLIQIGIRMAVLEGLKAAFPGVGGFSAGGSFGIPGFAAGGGMKVKGRGGTDKNVLSLNGQPMARVSMGETVSVTPSGRGKGGSGPAPIYVDARGAVMNDQFAQMILTQAKAMDQQTGMAAYRQAVADSPSAVAARNRYG